MILRHLFSPLNNTRLSNLCGPTDAHLRSSAALALAHASLPLADAPGYELAAQLPDPCAAVAACMLLLQGRDPKASRRLPAVAAS